MTAITKRKTAVIEITREQVESLWSVIGQHWDQEKDDWKEYCEDWPSDSHDLSGHQFGDLIRLAAIAKRADRAFKDSQQ